MGFLIRCDSNYNNYNLQVNDDGMCCDDAESPSPASLNAITTNTSASASAITSAATTGATVTGGRSSQLSLIVNVNGIILPFSAAAQQAIQHEFANLEPSASLYPTVSLHSPNTRVWCRFSEADMVQRSRDTIGAVRGARVYCLDGTLLIGD